MPAEGAATLPELQNIMTAVELHDPSATSITGINRGEPRECGLGRAIFAVCRLRASTDRQVTAVTASPRRNARPDRRGCRLAGDVCKRRSAARRPLIPLKQVGGPICQTISDAPGGTATSIAANPQRSGVGLPTEHTDTSVQGSMLSSRSLPVEQCHPRVSTLQRPPIRPVSEHTANGCGSLWGS